MNRLARASLPSAAAGRYDRRMADLPAIDLGHANAERSPETIRAIGDALREVGFLSVENHGVPLDLIDRAYAAAVEFFQLPAAAKSRYSRPELFGQRGYTGFAVEKAIGASVADLKEFYQLGRDHGPSAYGPNVWPDEVPPFRESFAALYDALERLATRIATACSLYLERPAGFLPSRIAGGESVLRVIHYPPLPVDVPAGAVRAAAHEDINFLTLLCGATADGLEIQTRDGRWHAVSARHSQIVVDAGDMLQNLTGGLFRSTTHRVVNPAGRDESRLSMPFFVHPSSEVDLTPLPDLADRAGSSREFRSVTAGEFLTERLTAIRSAEQRKAGHALPS